MANLLKKAVKTVKKVTKKVTRELPFEKVAKALKGKK